MKLVPLALTAGLFGIAGSELASNNTSTSSTMAKAGVVGGALLPALGYTVGVHSAMRAEASHAWTGAFAKAGARAGMFAGVALLAGAGIATAFKSNN